MTRLPIRVLFPDYVPATVKACARLGDETGRVPPEITLSPAWWATATGAERYLTLCHELAHIMMPTTVPASPFTWSAEEQRRHEAVRRFAAHLATCSGLGALLAEAGMLRADMGRQWDQLAARAAEEGGDGTPAA